MADARTTAKKAWTFLRTRQASLIDAAVLLACLLFIASYLPPKLMVINSTPTGGDIPAHNYLVSHLQESIKHGTIIGWADGWWSGFPMFQYYFFLPYLMMALLGFVIPVNVAFKIISVIGIYALPVAVYFGVRLMKPPRAAPAVLAILSVPYVFVQTHSMWGVNIKSTLAGMISNSISFCLLVIFLGLALRDLEDRRIRPWTAVALTLLFYSHFFTTLIAIMVIGAAVLLFGRGWWGRVKVILPTGVIAVLCAAFWLFPLMAKSAYSIEFGGDWDEKLFKTFPAWAPFLTPFALFGLGMGIWKKSRAVGLFGLMLAISTVLWFFGGRINSSFGNIRFWPFIFFAFVVLGGFGIAYLLQWLKYDRLAVAGMLAVTLALLSTQKDEVSRWFKWNMDGVEMKQSFHILSEMMDELRGTPGRFINDQAHTNNRFGSDRIFEAMPAMIGKPFLVGGIVNSATGALFTYTVQCEISKGCAGFPKLVKAPEFNVDVAMKHMDLYSVSHIIAHYKKLKRAMKEQPDWEQARKIEDYRIYRRKGGPKPFVFVPEFRPAFLETNNWKERAIEWFSVPNLLDRPFAFVTPGESIPDAELSLKPDLPTYFGLLAQWRSDPTEISSWSMLGPFFHEEDLEDPYEWNPTGMSEAGLRPGIPVKGKTWRSFFREGKIDVDTMINPSHHLVVYVYAALYADFEQDVQLLLANDDEISAFWNGRRVKNAPRAEVEKPTRVAVRTRKGRNDLVIKLNQGVGGAFFHARVQTPEGGPVPGLALGPDTTGPAPDTFPAFKPTPADCEVDVLQFDDRQVRFLTTCPGEPHIIKYSHFPNWKVKGARKVYLVSPNFMLVYPREREVTLFYGSEPVDVVSRVLTGLGFVLLAGLFWWDRKKRAKP